eukprot:symbB.v1.2.011753.t1/scaffold750.1/size323489/5
MDAQRSLGRLLFHGKMWKFVPCRAVIYVDAGTDFQIFEQVLGHSGTDSRHRQTAAVKKLELHLAIAMIVVMRIDEKGVKKFIYVSAVLVNAKNLGEDVKESDVYKNWNNFGNVLEKKLEAEEYIKQSGLDYTIIRPVPMTNDFPRDVGGLYFAKPDSLLLQDGDVGKKVSRDDVGLAVLDAIFNPKASRGTFELTGVPNAPPTPREEWWEPKSGKKAV